jgi:hypothetical protein
VLAAASLSGGNARGKRGSQRISDGSVTHRTPRPYGKRISISFKTPIILRISNRSRKKLGYSLSCPILGETSRPASLWEAIRLDFVCASVVWRMGILAIYCIVFRY